MGTGLFRRNKRPSNSDIDSLNDAFFSDYHSRLNSVIEKILSKISELEAMRIRGKSNQEERLNLKIDEISGILSQCYDELDLASKRGKNDELSHLAVAVEDSLDDVLKNIEKNHLNFFLAQEIVKWGSQYKVSIYNIMNSAGCLGEHTGACVGRELPENFWELSEKDKGFVLKQLSEKLMRQLTPIIVAFDKILEKYT